MKYMAHWILIHNNMASSTRPIRIAPGAHQRSVKHLIEQRVENEIFTWFKCILTYMESAVTTVEAGRGNDCPSGRESQQ